MADRKMGVVHGLDVSASFNKAAIPNWPAYNPRTRPTMAWDDNIRVENNHRGDLIAMADAATPPAGGRGGERRG